MSQHVLLENAFKYKASNEIDVPKCCTFDNAKGYWVNSKTGQAMMEGPDPKPSATKKCDRETGEDQKGE